jgi:hypothetical protein
MFRPRLWLGISALAAATLSVVNAQEAVKINPENPKYLLFRGKPQVLISASEHYGSVINRPFDFEKYLDDAQAHHMTMTRTFLLYRELQSARNPSSPCKPESPDYIAPFVRTGPGKAMDGEPMYDLDKWNPEYFDRLHRYLDSASKHGIVVELTVFSNTYGEDTWALNPLRAANNLQHVGTNDWEEYITLKNPELVRRQTAFARKIIQETSGYDNVYYEICNEPGGNVKDHSTKEDVDAWQTEMARVLRDEMRKQGHIHLLSGQQAFSYTGGQGIVAGEFPMSFPNDGTFSSANFDIANNHPLPNTLFGGKVFQMGNFMSKELKLEGVQGFCRASYAQRKPAVLDEDNTASMYRDPTGWTIHRKRAWTALFSGCNYDYIDFSITVGSEAGTPASRAGIRSWMQHLSTFMDSFDYIHSKLDSDWVIAYPKNLLASGLSASGRDYAAYLADARELTDLGAGEAISGEVSISLPAGTYDLLLYSPVTGEYSPAIRVHGGEQTRVTLPSFTQDIVIRATRQD